jgi:hypothetical protein
MQVRVAQREAIVGLLMAGASTATLLLAADALDIPPDALSAGAMTVADTSSNAYLRSSPLLDKVQLNQSPMAGSSSRPSGPSTGSNKDYGVAGRPRMPSPVQRVTPGMDGGGRRLVRSLPSSTATPICCTMDAPAT